jgi:Cyclophilin type peptidyl-prolyl cis-trans isomerase/CLD
MKYTPNCGSSVQVCGYSIHPHRRCTDRPYAGVLAMANSGPNTNGASHAAHRLYVYFAPLICSTGSQFFLTLAPTPYLDGKHTIFGRVSSGMRVVQRLGAVATDNQDRRVSGIRLINCASLILSLAGLKKMSRYTRLGWRRLTVVVWHPPLVLRFDVFTCNTKRQHFAIRFAEAHIDSDDALSSPTQND